MKIIIHVTRDIDTLQQGEALFNSVMAFFAADDLVHVNAIADHNYKHPEGPDHNQDSNPYAKKPLAQDTFNHTRPTPTSSRLDIARRIES